MPLQDRTNETNLNRSAMIRVMNASENVPLGQRTAAHLNQELLATNAVMDELRKRNAYLEQQHSDREGRDWGKYHHIGPGAKVLEELEERCEELVDEHNLAIEQRDNLDEEAARYFRQRNELAKILEVVREQEKFASSEVERLNIIIEEHQESKQRQLNQIDELKQLIQEHHDCQERYIIEQNLSPSQGIGIEVVEICELSDGSEATLKEDWEDISEDVQEQIEEKLEALKRDILDIDGEATKIHQEKHDNRESYIRELQDKNNIQRQLLEVQTETNQRNYTRLFERSKEAANAIESYINHLKGQLHSQEELLAEFADIVRIDHEWHLGNVEASKIKDDALQNACLEIQRLNHLFECQQYQLNNARQHIQPADYEDRGQEEPQQFC